MVSYFNSQYHPVYIGIGVSIWRLYFYFLHCVLCYLKTHNLLLTFIIDSPKKCGVCLRQIKTDDSTNSRNKCSDPSHRFECFQHRRVHSVSHLESTVRSPDSPRSLSCTPTRTLPSSAVTSPVSFFLPSARVYTPVFPHGHTMECHHRRNVSVHDSTSHTSLLSLESEQSMECQGHTDLVPLRGDEVAYCSNSSAVSMTSENSPQSWNVKPDCYSRLKVSKWFIIFSIFNVAKTNTWDIQDCRPYETNNIFKAVVYTLVCNAIFDWIR